MTDTTPWRNGSASDSRSEGCVFKSRRGQNHIFSSRKIQFSFSKYTNVDKYYSCLTCVEHLINNNGWTTLSVSLGDFFLREQTFLLYISESLGSCLCIHESGDEAYQGAICYRSNSIELSFVNTEENVLLSSIRYFTLVAGTMR